MNAFFHYYTDQKHRNIIQKAWPKMLYKLRRIFFSVLARLKTNWGSLHDNLRILVLPLSEGLDFVALSRLKKRLPGCKLEPDEGDSSFNLNCPSFVTFCWERKKLWEVNCGERAEKTQTFAEWLKSHQSACDLRGRLLEEQGRFCPEVNGTSQRRVRKQCSVKKNKK